MSKQSLDQVIQRASSDARLTVFPRGGSPLRPGGMMVQAQDGYLLASERNGDMGEWMRFTNTTPPQIECFSGSADTSVEGYLDLVQVA